MSTSLCWRPVPTEPDGLSLGAGVSLKRILVQEIWGHDGSVGTEWTTVDESLIPFLRGVAASSVEYVKEDAENMIDLINRRGQVQLRLIN